MQYLVLLDKTFALTGKFSVGHRKKCIQHIRDYGGIYHPNVTTKTAYLIVGQYSPTSKSATNKLKYAIKAWYTRYQRIWHIFSKKAYFFYH